MNEVTNTRIDHYEGDRHVATSVLFHPERCDFCDSEGVPIPIEYRVATGWTVTLGEVAGERIDYTEHDGRWGACAVCAALIDAGDEMGLLDRSLATHADRMDHADRSSVRLMQASFWDHKLPNVRVDHGEEEWK